MNIKVIINPSSGHRNAQNSVLKLLEKLKNDKSLGNIDIFHTKGKNDAFLEVLNNNDKNIDLIVAAGGDGTINEVVNGLVKGGNETPLAVYPAGTANDFANHIGMSLDTDEFLKTLKVRRILKSDVGLIGETYFINVASGGLLTEIAHNVSPKAKSVLGHMAYLIEGAKELALSPDLKSVKLKFKSAQKTIEDDILLFIVSNSSRVGGFNFVSPKADIGDGLLDVLILHKQNIAELINLFIQLNGGIHINDPRVSYFQTEKLEIECMDDNCIIMDIDGEKGSNLPVEIKIVPEAVNLIVSEKFARLAKIN